MLHWPHELLTAIMTARAHRRLPLHGITAFEAAARLGNFSRAAEELGLSQAAISRQMRTLENALSTTLFRRERYSVSLTDHGKSLFACVAPFIDELSGAVEQIQRDVTMLDEFVIFADLLVSATLSPLLPGFVEIAGETELRLVSSGTPIADFPYTFDVGLQKGRAAIDGYTMITVCEDEIIPVCQPGNESLYVDANGAVDLELATLLELKQLPERWPGWSTYCEATGIRYYSARQRAFSNYQSMLDAAEKGLGVALGWRSLLKPYIEDCRLAPIGHCVMRVDDGLTAYLSSGFKKHPLAEKFLQWLREQMSLPLQ